ncbi:MAG: tetratricopeptide repeat protein [Ramlibacter sp.]
MVVAALWAMAPSAQAQAVARPGACSVKPAYPLPQGEADLQTLLAQLDTEAPQCLLDAGFHGWRGAVLLSLRRPAAAIEALERSLLIDPNAPGVQLDYAQALLAVGDTTAARSLLQTLAARTDLPPPLRPLLERELRATDPAAWRTRWVLTTAFGHDSNLNNAPAASELTLTFPQGPVTLPLVDSFRPQRGTASLNVVQWQGLKPAGTQLWLLQAELRARHTTGAATRYQQADLSATWLEAPDAPRQWVGRVGATRIDFGGQRLLQSGRASATHQWQTAVAGWPTSQCRPGLGGEAEWRRYPATPELNGRYAGVVLSASCQATEGAVGTALANQLASVQLRWGRDTPDAAARPGGAYNKLELRATWEGRQGPFKFNADYGYTRQTDATGYSPLLADNLARVVARHSLRFEAARPLSTRLLAGPDWFVSAEVSQQTSNLAAFASRQSALFTGLRWTLQ